MLPSRTSLPTLSWRSVIKEDKEQSEEQMYTEVCTSVRVCESEGVWWREMGGKDQDISALFVAFHHMYQHTNTHSAIL